MPRRNARIDAFVLDALDALGFDGPRSNPRRRPPRDPRPRAPYHPSADPWVVRRAEIAEHRMHAAAARQQARYDADALETAEYHDAEADRLEAELEATRRNPDVDSAWVGVHDCEHHGLPSPMRLNPATKRGEGRYTDAVELEAFVNDAIARFDERPDAGPPTLLPKPPGLPQVRVVFTRGGRTNAGTCVFNRVTKECVIRLNGLLWDAMTEEERFDTVMHEAAHAIEFQRYGTSSHGPRWQFIAKAIGCSAEACVTGEAARRMGAAYREKMGLPKQGVRPKEAWTPGDVFAHQKTPRSKKTIGRIRTVGEHPDYASFKGVLVTARGTTPVSGMMAYEFMSLPTDADRDMLEQAEAASERARLAMFSRGRGDADKPAAGESLSAWLERTGRR